MAMAHDGQQSERVGAVAQPRKVVADQGKKLRVAKRERIRIGDAANKSAYQPVTARGAILKQAGGKEHAQRTDLLPARS